MPEENAKDIIEDASDGENESKGKKRTRKRRTKSKSSVNEEPSVKDENRQAASSEDVLTAIDQTTKSVDDQLAQKNLLFGEIAALSLDGGRSLAAEPMPSIFNNNFIPKTQDQGHTLAQSPMSPAEIISGYDTLRTTITRAFQLIRFSHQLITDAELPEAHSGGHSPVSMAFKSKLEASKAVAIELLRDLASGEPVLRYNQTAKELGKCTLAELLQRQAASADAAWDEVVQGIARSIQGQT